MVHVALESHSHEEDKTILITLITPQNGCDNTFFYGEKVNIKRTVYPLVTSWGHTVIKCLKLPFGTKVIRPKEGRGR